MAGAPDSPDETPDDTPDDASPEPVTAGFGDDAAVDAPTGESLDLDAIDRDLAAVDRALARLDDGSYWTDESTGAPIDDAELARDPTIRRRSDTPG